MSTVALQPATSRFARRNAGKTLEKPISLDYVRRFLSAEDFLRLEAIYPERKVHIWGVKFERLARWANLFSDDTLVLFRKDNLVYLWGLITLTTFNEELSLSLWGPDERGEPWGLVYFLKSVESIRLPASRVNEAAGLANDWNWQGFNVIKPPRADAVIDLVRKEISDSRN